jgi:hypothetical protein
MNAFSSAPFLLPSPVRVLIHLPIDLASYRLSDYGLAVRLEALGAFFL